MQRNKSYLKHFVRDTENRKQSLPSEPKTCYNCRGKGHLANECFIFWREDGNRFILVLCDTTTVGEKRVTKYKGSRQLWIPKRK